jgi:lipopolysaccharide biosynthesis glycosyltransferase
MKEAVLVTLSSKDHLEYAKQLFASAYFNGGWNGDYLLLACAVPPKDLLWFKNRGILIKECEPISLEFSRCWREKEAPFRLAKLNLFTPFFKQWEHVIYLDTDIIVRASFHDLVRIRNFAACLDFKPYAYLGRQIAHWGDLSGKYDFYCPTFNSGVMTFDTKLITDELFSVLLNLGEKYRNIYNFADQPVLNLYFYKKWKKISTSYNSYPDHFLFYGIPRKWFEGIILHLIHYRPWDPRSPYYAEWLGNYSKAELMDVRVPNIRFKRWTFLRYLFFNLYLEIFSPVFSLLIKVLWKFKFYFNSIFHSASDTSNHSDGEK